MKRAARPNRGGSSGRRGESGQRSGGRGASCCRKIAAAERTAQKILRGKSRGRRNDLGKKSGRKGRLRSAQCGPDCGKEHGGKYKFIRDRGGESRVGECGGGKSRFGGGGTKGCRREDRDGPCRSGKEKKRLLAGARRWTAATTTRGRGCRAGGIGPGRCLGNDETRRQAGETTHHLSRRLLRVDYRQRQGQRSHPSQTGQHRHGFGKDPRDDQLHASNTNR